MTFVAVTLELLLAVMLGLLGYFYLTDPEHFRAQLADAIARSPRVLRIFSPPWLYRGKLGLWQMRIMGFVLLIMSAVLLFAVVAAFVSRQ